MIDIFIFSGEMSFSVKTCEMTSKFCGDSRSRRIRAIAMQKDI